MSTAFDVIFNLEHEGIPVDIDIDKVVFDNVTVKDFIAYTDSTWENALKYRDNMEDWFKYEMDFTHNGKITTKLYKYCMSETFDQDKMLKIKTFLASKFNTSGKTCDGYPIDNEYHKDMFAFLSFICNEVIGAELKFTQNQMQISTYDFNFTTFRSNTDKNDIWDVIKHSLSYSFIYGANSKYNNFSYTTYEQHR